MANRLRALILSLLLLVAAALAPTLHPALGGTGDEQRQRIRALGRQAIELIERDDLTGAEAVLRSALFLDPGHPVNLYNLACLLSLQDRPEQALDILRDAAEAGFTDFAKIARDPDLARVRALPAYASLVRERDAIQRRAAERQIEALKAELGDGYIYEISESDRLIFATNTDAETLAALKHALTAQAHSLWDQVFENRPSQYIMIVLPSPEDYRKLIPNPRVRGVYQPAQRLLIASRLGQVMVHEFTHALHEADISAIEQDHPVWIMEGMASLFEAGRLEGDELVPADNLRLPQVQAAARRGRLIPLTDLLEMAQPEFMKTAGLGYGQSGSVLMYLHDQGLLRRFYDMAKNTIPHDPTGRTALERATGKSIDQLERDWHRWMMGRTSPPRSTGADGVFLGVSFREGHDGLYVAEVLPDSGAERGGIQPGDVVVGVAGDDVRDYPSLIVTLIDYSPGETVTLRVRRGGAYHDLDIPLGRRGDMISTAPARRGQ